MNYNSTGAMWIGTWEQETVTFGGNTLRLSSCSGLIMAEDDETDSTKMYDDTRTDTTDVQWREWWWWFFWFWINIADFSASYMQVRLQGGFYWSKKGVHIIHECSLYMSIFPLVNSKSNGSNPIPFFNMSRYSKYLFQVVYIPSKIVMKKYFWIKKLNSKVICGIIFFSKFQIYQFHFFK